MNDAHCPSRLVVERVQHLARHGRLLAGAGEVYHRRLPETVIVSSTPPTRMSAFTAAVNDVVSSIPSRLTVAKPGSVNVTAYAPGLNSTIRTRRSRR